MQMAVLFHNLSAKGFLVSKVMNELQQFITGKPGGFLRDTDIPELIKLDRLCQVLVRCGGCRFTCAAQDCAFLVQAIETAGDYVRDVSFPVGSLESAAHWRPDCPVTPAQMLPESFLSKRPAKQPVKDHRYYEPFNEGDCGGVFDGFSVSSDADSGL